MPREITPPALPRLPQFRISFKAVISAVIALVLVIGLLTCFYKVDTDSVGVVQRFGRFTGTVEPGLHMRLPFGIDVVTPVAVRRQLKVEFGFGTTGATNPNQFRDRREQEAERSMVTGDLNAAEVEWVVQYSISDPREYLFNLRDTTPTLRDFSESVMREVIGDRTVDEVLTFGRADIEQAAQEKLSTAVANLKMGIQVTQVQLNHVYPPAEVQKSFDEVSRAQQEAKQRVNVANGEYNKVIPRAKGEAEQKISEAEGYAVKRVNEAEGEIARFKALLEQYEKAPDVTRQRLYLETMKEVIPQLGAKIILDGDAKQFLPLMHLQQLQYSEPQPKQR